MSVFTLFEKGGLNHIVSLRCRFLLLFCGEVGVNFRLLACPLSFKAFSYSVLALLKISSELEIAFNLFSTEFRTCSITLLGWLDLALM